MVINGKAMTTNVSTTNAGNMILGFVTVLSFALCSLIIISRIGW